MKSVVFWFLSIQIFTQRFSASEGKSVEKWFKQFRDHFDSSNKAPWFMRYYENNEFTSKNGPIFILIGAETAISPRSVEQGFMFEMARVHRAVMYYIEHRYYGKSHVGLNTSPANLRYLNIKQVLADIELFIRTKKKELNMPNARTIVFGNSYGGNLAAWMRVTYPELVYGAVANSAPIYSKVDYPEFFETIANSFHKYDENCVTKIREAFSAVEELVRGPPSNARTLKKDFNLCDEPNLSDLSDVAHMMLSFTNIFSYAAYANKPDASGRTPIANTCDFMTEIEKNETPYRKLARAIRRFYWKTGVCLHLKYRKSLNSLLDTSWTSPSTQARLWLYQTCTELGYHQTSSSPESIFGSLIPLPYFMQECRDVFGEYYCVDNVYESIDRINQLYNSKLPEATNIIFTNGDLDPWHILSVLSDLNNDSPSILMEDVSHCEFMRREDITDPLSLITARCRVSGIISTWLS